MIINILDQRFVFVFGSNLAGRHGSGAALDANRFYGAQPGVAEGLVNNSYALPTKDRNLETLPLSVIERSVDRLFKTAAKSNKFFLVSSIGCGLAGYTDKEIAPLFLPYISKYKNVKLPGRWLYDNHLLEQPRYIIAGSRYDDDSKIKTIEAVYRELSLLNDVTLVSGACPNSPDSLAVEYYREYKVKQQLELKTFPAPWDRDRRYAGILRNKFMSWYSTHLIAFWDNRSRGTRAMIDIATSDGLYNKTVFLL